MDNKCDALFNSSVLSAESLTDNEFKDSLSTSLSEILKVEFRNDPNKQHIKENRNGLNFACPFCGDSATDSYKKRGWFLLDGKFSGHFKCFNCGKYMSISSFFRNFNKELDLSSTSYLSEHTKILDSSSEMSGNDLMTYFGSDNKLNIVKYGVSLDEFQKRLSLEKTDSVHKNYGYRYLVNRCQWKFDNFLYDPNGNYLVILNKADNYVIGFQIRDLTGKRKNKYMTFNLGKLSKIFKKDAEVPEELDRLSTIFNLFNADMSKPVIVTEGPLDSFLLPNAIASSGASKKLDLDILLYYLFDSDKTGNAHAVKMLENGSPVFMWSKLKESLGLPDRKKWDVNDVVQWCRANGHRDPDWLKFFSSDKLDMIDI